MGSSKSSQKVYDYLLSVDYGLCHGPIDSVNQIWIKDKPIWCGEAKERTDIPVNLPELFGGDDAEGGVGGVVEVYIGDDAQIASDQLARRFGLYSDIMPGYRGLAHLFFRSDRVLAASDDEIIAGGGTITPPSTVWEKVVSGLRDLYADEDSGKNANGLGFKWGTNNPYFPEVKVSGTRCPDTLGDDLYQIWPHGDPSVYPENYTYPESDSGGNSYVEATEIGFGPAGFTTTITLPLQVANGLATFAARYRVRCVYNGSLGTTPFDPAPCVYDLSIRQFDENDDPLPNPSVPGAVYDYYADTSAIVDEMFSGAIHPDAKTVSIVGTFAPWNVITSDMQITGDSDKREFILTYQDAYLHCLVDGSLGPLPDANMAHHLFEVLTNGDWGGNISPSIVNTQSFLDSSAVLHSENFGLSFIWTGQSKISTYIQEILDHIRGFVFLNPISGLWEMRLLREVADADTSPVLDPSNCVLSDPKRRTWDGTLNEIVVSYTDPVTEEEATVSSHDLGNIQIQGTVISETRDYHGIRNEELAQKVADRDVAEAAYPLWSAQARISRSEPFPLPGDVRVLNWPEDGISGMIVRVMKIYPGKIGDRTVKVDLVEDIFSIGTVRYRKPQDTKWSSEVKKTKPLSDTLVISAPAPIIYASGVEPDDLDARYPETPMLVFGTGDDYELLDFELRSPVTSPSGSVSTKTIATLAGTTSVLIDSGTDGDVIFDQEASSSIPSEVIEAASTKVPESGDLLVLGSDDSSHEIIMLLTESGGEWTVARGIYDTIPRKWVSPVRLWEFVTDDTRNDPTSRSIGETVTYELYPRGLSGTVTDWFATDLTIDISESSWAASSPGDPFPVDHPGLVYSRAYLPFRPANPQLDAGAGPTGFAGITNNGYPASLVATWANRNRTTEDGVAAQWDDGNVIPETGQTTLIRILDDARGYVNEIETTSGDTSYTFSVGDFMGEEKGVIQFWGKQGTLLSFVATELPFNIEPYGYGLNYGLNYGP